MVILRYYFVLRGMGISLVQSREGPNAAFPMALIGARPESYGVGKFRELKTFRRTAQLASRGFRGRIRIPGVECTIPDQEFTETRYGSKITISSTPQGKWPSLAIRFTDTGIGSSPKYQSLDVINADNSVDAWLLWTRVAWSIKFGHALVIEDDEGVLAGIAYDDDEMFEDLRYLASIVRKLKYIEEVFNTRFTIPDGFQPADVELTELVFRALTEGEFSMRSSRFTLPEFKPANFRLDEPPFSGPGEFSVPSRTEEEQSTTLLGKKLLLGPVVVTLRDSVVANRVMLGKLDPASETPVAVRLVVRDNQVHYRFGNYVGSFNTKKRRRKFARFKKRLLAEEPAELVSLVDDSLQPDVSNEEAMRVGMTWLLYNNFPDRYCSQEPIREQQSGKWLVPVWLAYSDGRGGPVGELQVDIRTGTVTDHTPVAHMRKRGAALAETLRNAG
jgi:hypothetical protein